MKAIMINVPSKTSEEIVKGDCTALIKKSRPKIDTPVKCYIYCTQDFRFNNFKYSPNYIEAYNRSGKVIGEFVCDNIYLVKNRGSEFRIANEELCVTNVIARQSCLDYDDMVKYLGNKDGYAWHMSNLVIYDKPKELGEFFTPTGKRPSHMLERSFSGWGYVEEREVPCKIGTTIYHLHKAGDVITEDKVFNYHFEICSKPCVSFENHFWYGTEKRVDTILVEHFGKYWFTDKAKAEARLKELKEEG